MPVGYFGLTGLEWLNLSYMRTLRASLHTRRCQLMDQVQISEKFQSERLLKEKLLISKASLDSFGTG